MGLILADEIRVRFGNFTNDHICAIGSPYAVSMGKILPDLIQKLGPFMVYSQNEEFYQATNI